MRPSQLASSVHVDASLVAVTRLMLGGSKHLDPTSLLHQSGADQDPRHILDNKVQMMILLQHIVKT
jgi:hypothetical protein